MFCGRAILNQAQHPRKNRLLDGLSERAYRQILPLLEPIPLPVGKVLYEQGQLQQHAYFPTEGIIALLYVFEDGVSAEIAMVGNEGLLGVTVLTGSGTATRRALVEHAGYAYRLPGTALKKIFGEDGELQALLLLYMQALMTQMGQLAVCNRHHSLDQQLCRCFLLCLDRMPDQELAMTHQHIANMLGVRREAVTQAALKLQHAEVLSYHRGRILVNDRNRLEARACECYRVVRYEYDRLLTRAHAAH
jgi:CRP-like cAMP-binding protein